jgi:ribulose-phosphate 3-epimerase
VIQSIKAEGMKVGMALKPGTPLQSIWPFIKDIDMVLVMTVEPGFGGQSFMPKMMEKVSTLRKQYPQLDIGVDGGLSRDTIDTVAQAGANVIVAGTSIFKASAPADIIAYFREKVLFYRTRWLINGR